MSIIKRNITAYLFLSIFSLFLIDQSIPKHHHHDSIGHVHEANHTHSQGEGLHHYHGEGESGHHHHNHHQHNSGIEHYASNGLLDFLLSMHSHDEIPSEFASSSTISKQKKEVDTSVFSFLSKERQKPLIAQKEGASKIYALPHIYSGNYLTSLKSRGPPALG